MLKRKKFWKRVFYVLGSFIALLLILFLYLVWVSQVDSPEVKDKSSLQLTRTEVSPNFYTLKNDWFHKSNTGLYELYTEGDPFERGVINGKLTKELIQRQEDYFSAQIKKMIPSDFYLHFLKYFIGWFNRNLADNITEEDKEEIYGISQSASEKYDYIGDRYARILNYHAAHDIGHALQNMALVGCTSFGTWGAMSQDSTMIIGRNFDFYISDDFAKEKIVSFCNPSQGYKFMYITWGGFTGLVSGMNEKGLAVTINAAKSDIPSGSATPVSLVAKEIVQYAKNIDEAIAIAKKRKMFVSESFLVGSAADKKAVVIEKTPDSLDIYDPQKNFITCANHFQGPELSKLKANVEQMDQSASVYRYNRLSQLLQSNGKNTVEKTIAILRDHEGMNNEDIGLGNEKALNQFIAHHSIVFEPEKLKVWISTSPWQLGQFVCYDLHKVFTLAGSKKDREIYDTALNVPADPFIETQQFKNFLDYRNYAHEISDGKSITIDSVVSKNPNYYHAYVLAGDYSYKKEEYQKALDYYEIALTKVIATKKEEDYIKAQIQACNEKLAN
jgi:hypothetical protein